MTTHVHIAGTEWAGVFEIVATGWDGRVLKMTREAYFRLRQRSGGLPVTTAAAYILYGSYFDRSDEERRKLYVGKTTDPGQRGYAHERDKNFWTDALVFTSSGPWMNSAHAGAVEKEFIKWARDANRYIVTNGSSGADEPLGPYDQTMVDLFIRDVRAVMQMAGIDVFEPDPFGLFYFDKLARSGQPAFKARGRLMRDALLVLAGSTLPAPSASDSGYEFLHDLEKDGHVKRSGEVVEVVLDTCIPFTGPFGKILGTYSSRWLTANRRKLSEFVRGRPEDERGDVEPATDSEGTRS